MPRRAGKNNSQQQQQQHQAVARAPKQQVKQPPPKPQQHPQQQEAQPPPPPPQPQPKPAAAVTAASSSAAKKILHMHPKGFAQPPLPFRTDSNGNRAHSYYQEDEDEDLDDAMAFDDDDAAYVVRACALVDDALSEGGSSWEDEDEEDGIDDFGDDDTFDEICRKAQIFFSEDTRDVFKSVVGGRGFLDGAMAGVAAAVSAERNKNNSNNGNNNNLHSLRQQNAGGGASASAAAHPDVMQQILNEYGGADNFALPENFFMSAFDSHPDRGQPAALRRTFTVRATLPKTVLRGVVPPPRIPAPNALGVGVDGPMIRPAPALDCELSWAVEVARVVQNNGFTPPTEHEWNSGAVTGAGPSAAAVAGASSSSSSSSSSTLDFITTPAATNTASRTTSTTRTTTAANRGEQQQPAAVNLDPMSPASWSDLGVRMAARDKVELHNATTGGVEKFSRQECFLRAIKMNPTLAEPWLNLALTMDPNVMRTVKIRDRRMSALDCIAQALQLQPGLGQAWCAAGLELASRLKELSPETLAAIMQVELDSREENNNNNNGNNKTQNNNNRQDQNRQQRQQTRLPCIIIRNGDATGGYDMVECFVRAIELAPFFHAPWYGLAQCLMMLKRPSATIETIPFDAANCLHRALMLDPTDAAAWHHMAVALPSPRHRIAMFGGLYQARDCLAQALSIDPHLNEAWCALYAISPPGPSSTTNSTSGGVNNRQEQQQHQREQRREEAAAAGGMRIEQEFSGPNELRVRGFECHNRTAITTSIEALTTAARAAGKK